MKKLLILSLTMLLASCSMFSSEESTMVAEGVSDGVSARPTLAELDLQPIKVEPSIAPRLSLKETRDEYAALLPLLKDEKQKQQVAFRLADIEMQLAEIAQEEGIPLEEQQAQVASTEVSDGIGQLQPASYFNKAISRYREVLEQQADLLAKVNDMKAAAALEGATPVDIQALEEAKRTETKYMDAMYQLSRALDLDGKKVESVEVAKRFLETFPTETNPVTNYHIELYFRIGEYYFTRTDYETAVFNYGQVLALSEKASSLDANNFYGISAYMQGWSFFKQEDHPNALVSFSKMLDDTLDDNSYTQTFTRIEELPLGQQRLVKDTLRIMALLFSYSGNGEAIRDFFAANGERAYEHLIYEELAQQHLNNDRFKDSADTLLVFASTYPTHGRAVEFYVRHIDAYILGDFPALVLEAKQGFVAAYGIDGPHFDGLTSLLGQQTAAYLRQYLKELAQSEHSIAQTLDRMLNTGATSSAGSETAASSFVGTQLSEGQSASWSNASVNDLSTLRQEAFEAAALYYDQFIRTFSPDEEVAQMRFYLAEALSSAGKLNKAIESFEIYAYQDSPNPLASEAAYAALLLFERVTSNAAGRDANFLAQLEARKMISQQLFVENFAADPRTVNVTQSLMQRLFEQEKYMEAMRWANWLLAGDKLNGAAYAQSNFSEAELRAAHIAVHDVEKESMISARLVLSHSHFALENYKTAQAGYETLLSILPSDDERVEDLTNRLAATFFQQSEQVLASAKVKEVLSAPLPEGQDIAILSETQKLALSDSIALLGKIMQQTPNSTFRAAAQYDSATYLLALESWADALSLLLDFQTRFPTNDLVSTIPGKLLVAYEKSEQWEPAANMLIAQHKSQPDTQLGRESLFVAAEYYLKAGNKAQALDSFRSYAHRYPSPLSDANEARFKLTEFYRESGEQSKRRFWLNKLIDADRAAKDERSDRSRYLAAMASMVFANDADLAYKKIKLTLPLNNSLQRKQTALSTAIGRYDGVMAYGVAEFTTQANYALANLYAVLATDLMDSARPTGLSALEMSQYELLLEEQAFPFEETSISLHENNAKRAHSGLYDDWVKESLKTLEGLLPVRYRKPEQIEELSVEDFE
ncbi:tetratricopeptide repeat protein [Glaciecola sp. MH2013]|uniref:tetratricopeptide repeat protein n=1 Tax=Glaciecola sp. MH2013 TaxID=2785524 RepID=UPI0018A1104A|nr:tetratricopeptide repeat protein [Glaciecola sp. MH2013]MBF7074548.1 tetratricopeptide repeat protein [Glaciecola sp. MH2013]